MKGFHEQAQTARYSIATEPLSKPRVPHSPASGTPLVQSYAVAGCKGLGMQMLSIILGYGSAATLRKSTALDKAAGLQLVGASLRTAGGGFIGDF